MPRLMNFSLFTVRIPEDLYNQFILIECPKNLSSHTILRDKLLSFSSQLTRPQVKSIMDSREFKSREFKPTIVSRAMIQGAACTEAQKENLKKVCTDSGVKVSELVQLCIEDLLKIEKTSIKISITYTTYEKLLELSKRRGQSMQDCASKLVEEFLGAKK